MNIRDLLKSMSWQELHAFFTDIESGYKEIKEAMMLKDLSDHSFSNKQCREKYHVSWHATKEFRRKHGLLKLVDGGDPYRRDLLLDIKRGDMTDEAIAQKYNRRKSTIQTYRNIIYNLGVAEREQKNV